MSIISETNGGKIDMRTTKNTLNEKEIELVKYLMSDCRSTGDIPETSRKS